MRRLILPTVLGLAITAIALAVWAMPISPSARLRHAMKSHGLAAANIAYGHAGAEPHFLSINAPDGLVRPYYSLSKPVTAAAATQLLDLEQEIAGASVRQILQHSGGWDRAMVGDPVTQGKGFEDCTALPAPQKQFEPGERYAYSNIGYCLIGTAIKDVSGIPYREAVNELFPETKRMHYDPRLGPAGGWSGTAGDFFRFASRPVPRGTGDKPIARPGDVPYGLGWAVGPDFLTHFGALNSNFAIVVKQDDFVAVGLFDGRPADDKKAAIELRSILLRLNERP